MEQKQKSNEVAEKQIRAYRKRLQEILAETEGGTSMLGELQDLALEASAAVPPFQEGNGAEADIRELLAYICKLVQAKSTRRVRRPATRKRLVSAVATAIAAFVRLPREAASS